MPVFSRISSAVIGDQHQAALRIRSSFVQARSPRYTASASRRGSTRNRARTSTGGNGVTGGRVIGGRGLPRAGSAATPWRGG